MSKRDSGHPLHQALNYDDGGPVRCQECGEQIAEDGEELCDECREKKEREELEAKAEDNQ